MEKTMNDLCIIDNYYKRLVKYWNTKSVLNEDICNTIYQSAGISQVNAYMTKYLLIQR